MDGWMEGERRSSTLLYQHWVEHSAVSRNQQQEELKTAEALSSIATCSCERKEPNCWRFTQDRPLARLPVSHLWTHFYLYGSRRHRKDACFRLVCPSPPLFFFSLSVLFNTHKPYLLTYLLIHSFIHPPPINIRPFLFVPAPLRSGRLGPASYDVIAAVPALPRVVVGPASTATLSCSRCLSIVVVCPTSASASAYTSSQLPAVPIPTPPPAGRTAPSPFKSTQEGCSQCVGASGPS